MEQRITILSGVPAAIEAKLRSALPEAEFRVATDDRAARDLARNASGAGAIVWLGGDREVGFRTTREVTSAGARTIVVGPAKDADLILRAMREGAVEFVTAGDEAALVNAVRTHVRPRHGTLGRVYSVFPAKGGVGATTIATNLAGALQRTGVNTCIVDLNLNMGDVLAFLDLPGGYSLSDLVMNQRRLDRELIDATLVRHSSGVHVVAQSHQLDDADRVDAAAVASAVEFLRQHFGAVVIDGLRSFDDLSVAALDAADDVLLVLTQEVPAVRDARRCAELLKRLGHGAKVKLVVNRFQKQSEIGPAVIADTVGLEVSATISNDYPAVVRSVNKGLLLAEESARAPVTRDLDALVTLLDRTTQESPAAPRKSLLQRFFAPKVSHATE